jgi:molecular chaperone IbpA
MTSNSLALLNQLRPMSVGFNDIFERFEAMLGSNPTLNRGFTANYPPYNIIQVGEGEYLVQVALAGFKKEDISVTVSEGYLTIENSPVEVGTADDDSRTIHKGISTRWFKRSFTIADDVDVTGAELADGLLTITMVKQLPEAPEVQVIDIK